MVASGVVDAQTWVEEPATRHAFVELLSRRRLIGGQAQDRLTELFAESVAAAEEITEALGVQVRRVVELLVQALSEVARDAVDRGEPDPLPAARSQVYAAAVTVMMRVVFLLFAEERGLLPQGRLFAAGYGISGELAALDYRTRTEGSETLDATRLSWHRRGPSDLTGGEDLHRKPGGRAAGRGPGMPPRITHAHRLTELVTIAYRPPSALMSGRCPPDRSSIDVAVVGTAGMAPYLVHGLGDQVGAARSPTAPAGNLPTLMKPLFPGVGSAWDGVGHDVVGVLAGALVERTAAGDQDQAWLAVGGEHLWGQRRFREAAHGGHHVALGPVIGAQLHLVARS